MTGNFGSTPGMNVGLNCMLVKSFVIRVDSTYVFGTMTLVDEVVVNCKAYLSAMDPHFSDS